MKKVFMILGMLLVLVAAFIYVNNRFGLLSLAGLNSKGLPVSKVNGSLSLLSDSSSARVDHSDWTRLLKMHVKDDGSVDYKGFILDKGRLQQYLSALSKQPPTNDWPVQEQLAYYINLYNAYTVFLILEHYPVKSIKDINRAWTRDFVKIGDKQISLGGLEHSILRKMNEPRIHFAINCASLSCPKLVNEAYTADKLDSQLHLATTEFINSDKNSIEENNLKLSRIFSWYKQDFAEGDLIRFIDKYTGVKLSSDAKIGYMKYDWSLNEQQ